MSAASVALDREGLRELGDRVVATAGEPSEPFGVYVFAADAPESELARHVEREVFYEYFDNTPELLEAEYLGRTKGRPSSCARWIIDGDCRPVRSDSYCRHLRA